MTKSGYIYRASAGETFDSIAFGIYGDEKYAAELISANPAIGEKMVFTGGEELQLPVIGAYRDEQRRNISAAPWRE